MNRSLIFKLLLISLFVSNLTSCTNSDIKQKLQSFTLSPINLPDSLEVIKGETTSIEAFTISKPTLIVYVDSLSCSSCRIGHLMDYCILYDSDEVMDKVDVRIIFSPKKEEYEKVKNELSLAFCEFPLFMDQSNTINDVNGIIAEDNRFHSFLIDMNYKPIYVGDPTKSDDLWHLFEKVVSQLY